MSADSPDARLEQRRADLRARAAQHPLAREVTEHRLARMVDVALARLVSVTVVLENLWDPHNAAAVVRTAEGLGIDCVHVVEHLHRYRTRRRVLQGADRWLRVERHAALEVCLDQLRAEGFLTCAADLGPGCLPISMLPVDRPLAIVVGSEKDGLTPEARNVSTVRFTIPMVGFTGSFNVSVGAAVALWDLTSRRRAHLAAAGDLDDEKALDRITGWLEAHARRNGRRRPAREPAPAAFP